MKVDGLRGSVTVYRQDGECDSDRRYKRGHHFSPDKDRSTGSDPQQHSHTSYILQLHDHLYFYRYFLFNNAPRRIPVSTSSGLTRPFTLSLFVLPTCLFCSSPLISIIHSPVQLIVTSSGKANYEDPLNQEARLEQSSSSHYGTFQTFQPAHQGQNNLCPKSMPLAYLRGLHSK